MNTITKEYINPVHYNLLEEKIMFKQAVVGVIGMGYVGLPNMVSKAQKGYSVIGFDLDENKVNLVNQGFSFIEDVPTQELSNLVLTKRKIMATTDFGLLNQADVIMICVPTPIDKYKQPDLSYIKKAVIQIEANIKEGTLIILESTTYPGTTEEHLVTYLENRGHTVGDNIFIAYSPERIDPSNKKFNVDNTPRIVGGHTQRCTSLATEFIGGNVMPVSSTKVAELSKVFENTFRFVNIALSNELTQICEKMDIDVWEVIDASATKPFGFMPFYPSVGIGGHCIPVDPYYLTWYSKLYNVNASLIETAGSINDRMNDFTINKITTILNKNQQALNGSKIAILGASYKKDVADVRESSIFRLIDSLKAANADITIYDPHVTTLNIDGENIPVHDLKYTNLCNYNLVVLLTDHSAFDYLKVFEYSNIILDTRNIFKSSPVDLTDDKYYKL